MFLGLDLGMGIDLTQLDADLRSASDKIIEFGKSDALTAAEHLSLHGASVGAAAGTRDPDTKDNDPSAAQAAALSSMGSRLAAAMAPLQGIGGRISEEFDRVGGTIVTLARRIDAAMRFPAFDAAVGRIGNSLLGVGASSARAFAAVAAGSVQASRKAFEFGDTLGVVTTLASTALTAVAGRFALIVGGTSAAAGALVKLAQGVFRVGNYFGSLGDVAGKVFSQLFKIGTLNVFRAPEAGARAAAAAVNDLSASARVLGRELLAAFGVFGLAYKFAEFFKGGIKGAMDLGETVSKTQEVFGKSTASVVAQSDEMAKAFGLPKQAMLDAASSFGLVGKGAGQTQAEAARMSNTLAKLAADASSFYNVPLDVSLEKMRAGLVGEAEPLRAFGVLLTEDAVKAEALSMGLAKSAKDLDNKAKIAARASLIEKGLADATGDLARTQDSAANQFRKAGGGLQNFATSIGEVLMPAVKSGVGAFNELLATVIEVFERNRPVVAGFAEGVKAAFDKVGFVLRNSDILWKIAQLRAAEFVANTVAVIRTIPANLAVVGEWIANNWSRLIFDGVNYVLTLFVNLGKNLRDLGSAIVEFFRNPTQGFKFELTPLLEGFQATADALPEMVKPAWVSMQNEIDKLGAEMAERESKRAQSIAKSVAKPALAKSEEGEKKGDQVKDKLAGIAEFGSKEAYRTIALSMLGGKAKKGDEQKQVARNTKTVADEAQKQTKILDKIASRGLSGVEVLAL